MLVELRKLHEAENGTDAVILDKVGQYARPYRKYGIPLTPGTARDGSGHLDVILEYRPTHIVHLAGTQSDSLLSANYHAQGEGASPSHRNAIHQNKDEEEDDMLKESVSSRPHLYDLRMGVTGMEQLLSGAVAQMMIPPRAGPASAITAHMSESDMVKIRKPHIVYASSYDAMYFRDTDVRLKQHARRTVVEHETLGNTSPPMPKTPSRGIHGMSRLVDEILASSYHALHNIPSIGLRFDAIYGPRGFGVPSTSVPIYHADRIKTTKRGVSPDVDLAETAVRSLYWTWTESVNANEEATRREAEKKMEEDIAAGGEEAAAPGRRLEEARRLNLIEEAGWMHLAHERRDFVFVDGESSLSYLQASLFSFLHFFSMAPSDAVGAIITAMQYRPVNDSPTTFNIGSGEMSDLASLADEIQELVIPHPESDKKTSLSKNVIDVEQSSLAHAASLSSHDYLRWSANTSIKDGAARLLAWHLDRAMSFFRPASSSDNEVDYSTSQSQRAATGEEILLPLDGEEILSRRGITTCSYEDPTCLRELHSSYPCSSECSTRSCTPSVFDGVMKISHELTEDCDVVLYTMALGYDVEYLGLETEYSDGEEQEKWWETTVCTIAFVPSESTLVKKIISQVPPEKLKNRGVTPASSHDAKVKSLNGYLAHHGWVLILVDDATKPLTAEDLFVPKLSPARLFHPTVRKAMFVDENFSHTPYPEDAQFLASETSRGVLPKRTISGPDAKGHKTKYKLPEEPQRRAVLLVSPMRKIPDIMVDQMPLKEITLYFIKDTGLEPNETEEIRTQREFYERARSSINSMDLRSLNPTVRHKIEIDNFIRSKWIVHHLKLEEGHQLRCEWYREHIRWGTLLDQLSFAYVMAKRELTRKIILKQPLPPTHEEPTILQQIIRIKSDAHEWHPIFSAEGALKPIHHSEISLEPIPQNLQDLPDNEITAVNPENAYADVGSTFYVRIMSDNQMSESRKKWMKARNNHRKYVAQENAKEEAN
jgi:nucleoside-diphosphate-sugar epimerase